jgi:hypothetical protein
MDFYEKALFVKPTWRLPRGRVQRLRLPFARAMLLSALFRQAHTLLVARCIG